jgi:hypothetical protein
MRITIWIYLRKSYTFPIDKYHHEIESRNVNIITLEVIEFENSSKTKIDIFLNNGIWRIISKLNPTIIAKLGKTISKKDFDKFGFFVNRKSKAFVKTFEGPVENKKNSFKCIIVTFIYAFLFKEIGYGFF